MSSQTDSIHGSSMKDRNSPAKVSCSFGILVSNAKLASKIVSASLPSQPTLHSSPANPSALGFKVGFKLGGGVRIGPKLGLGVRSKGGVGLGLGVEPAAGLFVGDGPGVDIQLVLLLHSCSR